jgi:hypothetical protein
VTDWTEEGELEVGGMMRFPTPTTKPGYYKLLRYDELPIGSKVT